MRMTAYDALCAICVCRNDHENTGVRDECIKLGRCAMDTPEFREAHRARR